MISELEIVSRQTCFNLREENLTHKQYREDYELDYIVSGALEQSMRELEFQLNYQRLQMEM